MLFSAIKKAFNFFSLKNAFFSGTIWMHYQFVLIEVILLGNSWSSRRWWMWHHLHMGLQFYQ